MYDGRIIINFYLSNKSGLVLYISMKKSKECPTYEFVFATRLSYPHCG